MPRALKSICVYCASSQKVDASYFDAAARLGQALAQRDITLVYGGSSLGPMGALADAALAAGGRVIGVMPREFESQWAHRGLTELRLVDGMHQRKDGLIAGTDAVVALPGGSGTFEELMEALTLKRLGLYVNPIVLVNSGGYYDPLIAMFQRAVDQRFMDQRHMQLWTVVSNVDDVLHAIENAPAWSEDARRFATVLDSSASQAPGEQA